MIKPKKPRCDAQSRSVDDYVAHLAQDVLPQLIPRLATQSIADQKNELRFLISNCHKVYRKSELISFLIRYEPCVRDTWIRNLIATLADHLQRNSSFSIASALSASELKDLSVLQSRCRWTSDAEQQSLIRLRAAVLELDDSPRLCDWNSPTVSLSASPAVHASESNMNIDNNAHGTAELKTVPPPDESSQHSTESSQQPQAPLTWHSQVPHSKNTDALDDEDLEVIQSLLEKLRNRSATDRFENEIAHLQTLSERKLELLFSALHTKSAAVEISDVSSSQQAAITAEFEEEFSASLFRFSDLYITDSLRYIDALTFVRTLLLPRVIGREKPLGRAALQLILALARKIPKQMISAFLVPLLMSPTMSAPQAEVISRVLREGFSTMLVSQFLKEVFAAYQLLGDRGDPLEWTDAVMELLTKSLPLLLPQNSAVGNLQQTSQISAETLITDDELLAAFLHQANLRADAHPKSLKFCALLAAAVPLVAASFAVENVNAHRAGLASTTAQSSRFAQSLSNALNRTNTYLTKAALNKLKGLM